MIKERVEIEIVGRNTEFMQSINCSVWVFDTEQEQASEGFENIFRSHCCDLTKQEAAQVALAVIVFGIVPLEQITHNDWVQYLK